MMSVYIGTKIVRAQPQAKLDATSGETLEGYKVVYDDGYVSWSPKDVFERCYRLLSAAEVGLIDG